MHLVNRLHAFVQISFAILTMYVKHQLKRTAYCEFFCGKYFVPIHLARIAIRKKIGILQSSNTLSPCSQDTEGLTMLILRSPTLYEILCSKLNSISLYSCVNWEVSLLPIDKILTKNRIQNTRNESHNN